MNQKSFYQEINGETRQGKIIPNAEESKRFWGGIWDEVKDHNKQAEWLKEIKENVTYNSQDDLQITKEKIEMQCRKVPNCKAPGLDGVQGFWIKYLALWHQRIADHMEKILSDGDELPEWMISGRTVLC